MVGESNGRQRKKGSINMYHPLGVYQEGNIYA